ncbi:hypothetical protein Dimus_006068 [Dionaea muscipula]
MENMKADGELKKYLNELPLLASNGDHHLPMSETHFGVGSSSGGFLSADDISSSVSNLGDSGNQMTGGQRTARSFPSGLPDYYNTRNSDDLLLGELGLARGFQNLHIGDRNGDGSGADQFGIDQLGTKTSDPNVARNRSINGDGYRSFQGFTRSGGFAQSPHYGAQMGFDQGLKSGLGQGGCKIGNWMESYFPQDQSNAALLSGLDYFDSVRNPLIQDATNRGTYGDGYSLGHCGMASEANKDFSSPQLCYDNMSSCKNEFPLPQSPVSSVGDMGYLPSLHSAHLIGANLACNPDFQDMFSYGPYSDDVMLQECGFDSVGNVGFLDSMNFSQMIQPKHGLNTENVARHSSCPRERIMGADYRGVPQCVRLMKHPRKLKPHGCEDLFVMPEYSIQNCTSKCNMARARSKSCRSGTAMQNLQEQTAFEQGGRKLYEDGSSLLSCHQTLLQPTYDSLAELRGSICLMAKDQYGCRFLQNKFAEGSNEDKMIIFNEIIGDFVELMVNPFGNYLIQKLLDVCDEDQRLSIVQMVTREPGELVRISLNTHGTRVVQKLIETLKTRKQISLVKQALEPGFLDLIKDLNGNHVVQRCLQCFSSDDNKFIFDAAAKLCLEIGTHQHGCCVLQKCIAHSKGEHQQNLIAGISANALRLAEDPFGNYVVQYIIELKIPTAAANLMPQFKGHFVRLSMQKFSSHVVEKCLKYFEDYKPKIIQELLSTPHFEQLLQDPFANYVIQSALKHTKGPLADALVAAIRPHTILRTNPYCKKIFSQNLLKK